MAELRKCIGSPRFGIEAHEAQVEDFPVQPSQKDGFGRMCRVHWNQYTTALRNAAVAAKAEQDAPEPAETTPAAIEAKPLRAKAKASKPIADNEESSAE